jgi:hypothetical protein
VVPRLLVKEAPLANNDTLGSLPTENPCGGSEAFKCLELPRRSGDEAATSGGILGCTAACVTVDMFVVCLLTTDNNLLQDLPREIVKFVVADKVQQPRVASVTVFGNRKTTN